MVRTCCICNEEIEERFGKLKGTALKVLESNKNKLIYVCSLCQQKEKWIEKAKIKSA